MRPYLAVVKDSFREALASRTLWILLILITITLAALAPFSYREVLTAGLGRRDITDVSDFVETLRSAAGDEKPSPGRHIWSLLDPELQEKLRKLREPSRDAPPTDHMAYGNTLEELRDALNEIMEREEFFDRDAWRGVDLRSEARRLAIADPQELTKEEIGRRNRLVLEAAFPELVRISRPVSTQFTYLGMDLAWPVPVPADDLEERLMPWIALVLDWVVGPVGVFVAVLVTASIIPQMFDAGSLNLLLSKPISRSFLFLFKFIGGCAFTVIAATLLFVGLWAILGLRMGMWSHRMLLYIPIYLFLFSIYYAVSAFSGLVWRSTIVAIALSITFWAVCLGVGWAEGIMKSFVVDPHRITYIVQTNEGLLALNEYRIPTAWDAEAREWQEVFLTEQQQRIRNEFPVPIPFGSVRAKIYDPREDLFLAIQRGGFGGPRALWAGRESDGWRRMGGGDAPSDAFGMFLEPQGNVIVATTGGVQRLVGDPLRSSDEQPALFGLERFLPRQEMFEEAGEELPSFPEPHAAAMNPDSGELAVFSRGKVYILARQSDDRYAVKREVQLEIDEDDPAVIAFGEDTLLVADKDGAVMELDAATLGMRIVHQPEKASPPRFAEAAPGGRYLVVLFHNGKLWLFDNQTRSLSKPSFGRQGDISAVSFPSADEILLADRSTRVSRYRLDSGDLVQRYAPEMELLEIVYRYAVTPIYTVFPKPSELYKTSQYIVTGKETSPIEDDDDEDDLSRMQVKLNPWQPVWSSLAFVVLMLIVSCVYFERQEF
jgi:hypothetical protein